MTIPTNQRKVALALSIVSRSQRRRLLKALPQTTRQTLEVLVADIMRKGLNDRKTIELVLGEPLLSQSTSGTFALEELIRLSSLISPDMYARTLAACNPIDRTFLFSLLEHDYAARVQDVFKESPVLPQRLGRAVLDAVSTLLASGRDETCGA